MTCKNAHAPYCPDHDYDHILEAREAYEAMAARQRPGSRPTAWQPYFRRTFEIALEDAADREYERWCAAQYESHEFNRTWAMFKNEHARIEREQEAAAFLAGL